jgi:hypothetical protein
MRIELADATEISLPSLRLHPTPTSFLADGRRIRVTNEALFVSAPDAERRWPLKYSASSWLYYLHTAINGDIYGFTHGPLRMVRHRITGDRVEDLGHPFATADGHVGAAVNWRGKIVMAAYPGADMAVYDPSLPWNKGPTAAHNPWVWGPVEGEGHVRPQAMAVFGDEVVIASDSAYGVEGGAVARMNAITGRTIENIRAPFLNRTVTSVVADPLRAILYIGTGTDVTRPDPSPCVVAWDVRASRVLWECAPVPKTTAIVALFSDGIQVWGAAAEGYGPLWAFQLSSSGTVLRSTRTGVNSTIPGNVRATAGGMLYALSFTDRMFFRLPPSTGVAQPVAALAGVDGYTFAVSGSRAYFAHRGDLLRLRLH